jgi:hypothetical protein
MTSKAKNKKQKSISAFSFQHFPIWIALCFFTAHCHAQSATLDVTDFGARGDAVSITANTVSGSPVITVPATHALASTDIGKLILLFGAGPATTPTNHQDLIATIVQVEQGTNVTLSLPAGATSNDVYCTYGTQNARAFQHCVDAASGTNTVIKIPAGDYLLVPPTQTIHVEMKTGGGPVAAVVLRKGGIDFQGAGVDKTVLLGCGAWKLQGKSALRGLIFDCRGPVTNNTPLVFEELTMDGGVPVGRTPCRVYPASVKDGSGWDGTHGAVVDSGRGPLHLFKMFRNCRFTHWRGEILKSVAPGWDGYILVTNCLFDDGNASAFNMSFTHKISGCTFSNMYMAMEFYQAYCSNACYFERNILTNITASPLAINGALTNSVNPPYNIVSNTFYLSGSFGILTTPAQNLYVTGNQFICTNTTAALGLGCAGYQGSGINSNIVVSGNHFEGTAYVIEILGGGRNRIADVRVLDNTATGTSRFAGGYGWSTNVCFRGNTANAGLWSDQLKGQWFLDDASNAFPPWAVNGSSGKTNVITYAHGMRQQIAASKTNCVFALDDSQPERIPAGAIMEITNNGKIAAPVYFSATRANGGSRTTLQGNEVVTCVWTNGIWRMTEN